MDVQAAAEVVKEAAKEVAQETVKIHVLDNARLHAMMIVEGAKLLMPQKVAVLEDIAQLAAISQMC